jgi:glycerol uptake facilitator-like aquaporin
MPSPPHANRRSSLEAHQILSAAMPSRYVAPTSPNGFVILQSTDPLQAIGEFLGTFLFLFFAFAGAQVANEAETLTGSDAPTPSIGALLYISLSFGFSLAVCAWVFFRISGGLFNPAVTLALTLIGCLTYTRAAVVIIAQIVGAITSAGIVKVLFPEVRLVPNLAQQRRVD